MSFFAGIFCLSRARPSSYASELATAAALPDDFTVSRYEDTALVLLHGDLGVLAEPGFEQNDTAIAAIAGSLLLTTPNGGDDRSELARITNSVIQGQLPDLRAANGTFALCCYDPRSHQLTLAADCIGGRPLYYAVADGLLFFSTSLPVLKRLEMVPRTVDVGSYLEQEALCYPLGARTLYREIKVLLANECLTATRDKLVSTVYYDWASVPAAQESPHELALYCQRAVRDAVACRARPGATQISLLSGGLDSRVLVAYLLGAGYAVNGRNVAREGFQDQVYARRFAEAGGVPLSTVPWSEDLIGLSAGDYTARLLRAAVGGSAPGAVFSGDGGGETLGFLLMNREAARLLNQGRVKDGINEYLRNMYLSKYLFTPEAHGQLHNLVQERLEQELRKIGSVSLEKALHILVLTNDLRRHLHDYFDQITESRVELLLPFYDRRVLESVIRIPAPLEPFLKHQFYHRVIGLMPPIISSVPWQTYPGHAACPVEDPSPPPDQWSQPLAGRADKLAARSVRFALSHDFVPFLRRSVVLAAAVLHWTRLGNYGHLFKTCINLHELCGRNARFVIRDHGVGRGRKLTSWREMESLRYYRQRSLDYLEQFGLPLRWRSLLFYQHAAEEPPSLSVHYDNGGIGQPVSRQRFLSFDWPGDPVVTREAATWKRSEGRWAIAAIRGNTLDGFCWLEERVAEIRFFDLECQLADRCLYLSRVWVYPAMRDSGIGSSLMKLALGYAGQLGAEHVISGCVPHNHRMRYLFKTNGWDYYQRIDYRRIGAVMRYSVRPTRGVVRHFGSAKASDQLISRLHDP